LYRIAGVVQPDRGPPRGTEPREPRAA